MARDFFEGREVSKRQVKFVDFGFDAGIWLEVQPALARLFHGKCAFCESRLTKLATSESFTLHFRPPRDALNLDGTTSPKHYYWLAYEWQNLYPACAPCTQNKRNMFPVRGSRGHPGSPVAELEHHESRLLLDPCFDLPEEHLVFHDEGLIASVTLEDADLGIQTIDCFGLNRESLVDARRRAAHETREELALALADGGPGEVENRIAEIVGPGRTYAMARRQAAARWLEHTLSAEVDSLRATQLDATEVAQEVQASEPHRKQAFKRLERHEAQQVTAGIRDTATYARTTRITRVRLENFRGVEELEFEVPTTGWKMLIGENGTGKSSILQALAIALMGREQAKRLIGRGDLDPSKLVRRGATSARIVVHQAASMEPVEVGITRQGIKYPKGSARQKAILLGFGSARWLPRPKSMAPETHDWIRVRNLLNPFVPLGDANRWLRGLGPRTNKFRTAEGVVRALLRLADTTRLRIVDDEVRVQVQGQPRTRALTLDQLSDGYQTALAMATGIMGPLSSKWDVMREAEGIVLIDELDAHLHPRWKMRIVGDLRRAFPSVQFLASTHDPLCLRGLLDREILLLREIEGQVVSTDELPSPKNMRVDQLLTSRFFGLYSTLDPETERDLERYYDLLALDTRSPQQQAELDRLGESVAQGGVLGDSPRDQAIYAVVDRYIAKQLRTEAPSSATLQPETEERIAEMWRDTIATDPDVERALAEILER